MVREGSYHAAAPTDMEVVRAGDGQSAIDLQNSCNRMALLDLRLPEVDGVAATAAIPRVVRLPGGYPDHLRR